MEMSTTASMNDPASPRHDVVSAMFEDGAAAQHAREALVAAGIAPGDIELVDHSAHADSTGHQRSHHIWNHIVDRFMPHAHAHGYAEAVERGHAMVFVRAPAERQAGAMHILEQHHPHDVMLRVAQWRQDGWSGVHRSQSDAPLPMLHFTDDEPDHLASTGMINQHAAPRGFGGPLVNPMGIEVPGVSCAGGNRVRRYQTI